MYLIAAEARRRRKSGEAEESLSARKRERFTLGGRRIRGPLPPLKAKTITNNIRAAHRERFPKPQK